jgi:hypothetical protein
MFFLKLNSTGSVVWAKNAGGTSDDFVSSVTTDASGNAYFTGNFESSSVMFGSTTLNNTGVADMYLVKYDPSGNVSWVKSAVGNHAELGTGVAINASGHLFLTGYFYSPYSVFGQDTLMNTSVNSPPAWDPDGIDMFLIKYDLNGNVIWARSMGGSEHEEAKSVTTFGNAVYVGGIFSSSSVNTGSVTIVNTGTTALTDIFLMKYDDNGNVIWGRSAGGSYWDYQHSVKADPLGNIFLTGQFGGSSMNAGSTTLPNAGNYDVFVLKYDASGSVISAVGVGSAQHENGLSVTTDAAGTAYVAGYSAGSTLTFGSTTLNGAGNFDMFFAKLSASPQGIFKFQEEKYEAVKVSPNPSSGYFAIDLSEFRGNAIMLTVFNVTGKKIMEKKVPHSETDYFLDLTSEGEGVYFIKASSEGTSHTRKIVIRK